LCCEIECKDVLGDHQASLLVLGRVLLSVGDSRLFFERFLRIRWFPGCLGTPSPNGPVCFRFHRVLRRFNHPSPQTSLSAFRLVVSVKGNMYMIWQASIDCHPEVDGPSLNDFVACTPRPGGLFRYEASPLCVQAQHWCATFSCIRA
jgi:hypothetical protein